MPFEATADVVIVPGISLRTDISGSDCNYLRDVIRQLDRYANAAGIRPSTARITIVGSSPPVLAQEILLSTESDYWDHGYPSTAELPDGTLITTYYQRYGEDQFNSILYTKWILDEI